MSTSITFDEIRRESERTLGYALLASAATNVAVFTYRTFEVTYRLETLIKILTPEKIRSLTAAQSESIVGNLQQLHQLLWAVGTSEELRDFRKLPLLRGRISRFQEWAEAVSDLIDDFQLIGDPGLKRLISDCRSSVGI